MTNEQRIERARLVRAFLDSDEFKAAWGEADAALVREFKESISSDQALRVYAEMRAMSRLYGIWTRHLVDAQVASKEKEERERPKRGSFR